MPRAGKKLESEARARELYERLSGLKWPDMSFNEWCTKAGVNTSFFTNMRNGSEPTVGNLRSILEVVGTTLPEFFAHEAQGRLVVIPSEQALEEAFDEVLPELPRGTERRKKYLAEAVLALLAPRHNEDAIEETRRLTA